MKRIRLTILLAATFFVVPAASLAFAHPEPSTRFAFELTLDEFDDLLQEAVNLLEQRKFDEALAKCASAAALRPADHRPLTLSGFVFMAQYKPKEASEAFAKAIALDPRNAKLHYLKANADRFNKAKDASLTSVRKAIELDPGYAEAYMLLAETLGFEKKNFEEQIAAYRKVIELRPDMLIAYRRLAMILSASGDHKGTEQVARKALAIAPTDDMIRRQLAEALLKQGRLKEARVLWEGRANEKENTFPNFITLLVRAEKTEEAKANLAKNPNDPEALLQMGLMVMDGESWVVDGRQERAMEYFKKALAIDPHFAKAQLAIVKGWIEVADTFKNKDKNVDEELAKLKVMDPKLAAEAEAYRKSYSGGIKGGAPPPPPPKKN